MTKYAKIQGVFSKNDPSTKGGIRTGLDKSEHEKKRRGTEDADTVF